MQLQTLPFIPIEDFPIAITTQLLSMIDPEIGTSTATTFFHAPRKPTVTLREYVQHVVTFCPCTSECFVLALVYIDRLRKTQGRSFVNSKTIHRLFVVSLMVASKFFDDVRYDNRYYSRVGGISCHELNQLELELLVRLCFDCRLTSLEFDSFSFILDETSEI